FFSRSPSDVTSLAGNCAIGAVESVVRGDRARQPYVANIMGTEVAFVMDGAIAGAAAVRRKLRKGGALFQSNADVEIVAHLAARSDKEDIAGQLADAFDQLAGGFAIIALSENMVL